MLLKRSGSMAQMSLRILGLAFLGCASASGDGDPRFYTQIPTVANSLVEKNSSNGDDTPQPQPTNDLLASGPKADWIWGVPAGDRFVFQKEFNGGSKTASLIATCDNRMTVFINGKRVTQSSTWQSPVKLDVQKFIQPDKNTIIVEAANDGGPAGLVLKLGLLMPDGSRQYVVTDSTWKAKKDRDSSTTENVALLGKMGVAPWGDVFTASKTAIDSAPRDVFKLLPGFQVELLFTVPKDELGSWVSITFDNKGRLIASDQGGKGLCRITPPRMKDDPTKVEHLDVQMTACQGMVYAFDSLYCSVNGGIGSGLYRVRDTDNDDQFDEVKLLKRIHGGGEHGPHAVRLSPDGKSLYLIAGNHTNLPDGITHSRVPPNWQEDLLLPRQWDARGHARGKLAPGGWICKTDPEGKTWEVFSIGYRNAYDMDFNADGELFTYDADMEWDMGTPWYRPTRVVHATSGSEFGWRSGTGKWPPYFPDTLPPLINVGPGSPVGVEFGYGAKFPAKYQKAKFILDWTFGTIYALHLKPDGASYTATKEEFLARTPLPLTDAAIGPDGAMYFAIGGRGTQSELYRVTYVGDESTEPVIAHDTECVELRKLRRDIENYHDPKYMSERPATAAEFLVSMLSHEDRHIRYAARVALEHRAPPDNSFWGDWNELVLAAEHPDTVIQGVIALARQEGDEKTPQPQLLNALGKLSFDKLDRRQQLDLLRAYALVFIRLGEPHQQTAAEIAKRLDPHYPAGDTELNRELCRVLVYLKSPTVITKTLKLMEETHEPSQKDIDELLARNPGYGGTIAKMLANQPEIEEIHYAFALRTLRYGWTLEQRKQYFQWFEDALRRSGGASYQGFIKNIHTEALANVSEAEKKALAADVISPPVKSSDLPQPIGPGQDWTMEELVSLTQGGLSGRDFENGRRTYAAARCVVCHRFDGEGGATGPDLTNVAGRFSYADLIEAIVEPSKVISDQYVAHTILTIDGKRISGRIISDTDGKVTVLTDPEDATKVVELPADDIEVMQPSKVSQMPADLLNQLSQAEVLDLLAYLMSRGNPQAPVFHASRTD